jgi:hypothetical protein
VHKHTTKYSTQRNSLLRYHVQYTHAAAQRKAADKEFSKKIKEIYRYAARGLLMQQPHAMVEDG